MMQYIINKETGKLEFSAADCIEIDLMENQIIVQQNEPILFDNPHFDFTTRTFYDKNV